MTIPLWVVIAALAGFIITKFVSIELTWQYFRHDREYTDILPWYVRLEMWGNQEAHAAWKMVGIKRWSEMMNERLRPWFQ